MKKKKNGLTKFYVGKAIGTIVVFAGVLVFLLLKYVVKLF